MEIELRRQDPFFWDDEGEDDDTDWSGSAATRGQVSWRDPEGRALVDLLRASEWVHGREEVLTLRRPLSAVDADRSMAREWLHANDGRVTEGGVAAAIEDAAAATGLTIEDIRRAFAAKAGKPAKAQQTLRANARNTLKPLYEAGYQPELMCGVLSCSSDALWRLLR